MPKNIVLCCDGTWNRFDRSQNTNVVKLCSCLIRQTATQVVFYDPGVGTVAAQQVRTRIGEAWSKLLGGAFGFGMARNLEEAYSFVAEHYESGDRIYLFGFSRGAYTVRALAAVFKMFGLLERQNDNLFPYMKQIALSRRNGKPDFELEARFKHTFARPLRVHFIGCWDTVSSVGWLTTPITLPHTKTNDTVDHIRHAVSIDERRKNFRHNLFARAFEGQDLKEVWFPGVHADVGGGYAEAESGLSKGALKWMLREAKALELKVEPEREARVLGDKGDDYCRPDPLAVAHDPFDSIGWKILQFFPRRSYRPGEHGFEGYWDWSVTPRPREIDAKAVIHRSVLQRLSGGVAYSPPNLENPDQHPVED